MSKRLLFALLTAAMAVATVVGFTVPATPASAELRTVTVQLADGSTTTVTVDAHPAPPLDRFQTPPLPPVPTVPVPIPTPPGSPTPPPSGDQGQQPSDQPSPDDTPNADKGKKQKNSGGKEKAKPNALDEAPNAEPQKEVKKKLDEINSKLREPDGSPAPTNPTYFDALPGPAVAAGVPNFVIQKFRVPIFLLPIYQAAGIQYGIRWEVLAAINEIETDYGRNLNVSTAGAVGWMQWLPSTWKTWGVDGNHDGRKDPYNPVAAIFAAARYLKAAGADQNINRAIFAYNHAGWYVQSVMLRARLIAGVPPDVIGSLSGLTEGRFPVYAHARYADDIAIAQSRKKVAAGRNAAQLVESSAKRKGINIFARKGAPVVAVQDGVIKNMGTSKKLGRFVVLQDVYGNQYTYSQLGSLARVYPVPKNSLKPSKTTLAALPANGGGATTPSTPTPAAPTPALTTPATPKLPKPTEPATAGLQKTSSSVSSSSHAAVKQVTKTQKVTQAPAQAPAAVTKERLFAHPSRPNAKTAGGLDQNFNSQATAAGFSTFQNYFSRALGLNAKNSKLRRLHRGSHVVGGTILGRIGTPDPNAAPHVFFQIRPTGKGAPLIDPKPILDGWKLLEATAIYRASGKNALYSKNGSDLSIGQVLLLPKQQLEQRVLS